MMNERSKEVNITKDEAALYDRQIRLWGLDAQKRLINTSFSVVVVQSDLCVQFALALLGLNSVSVSA